MRIPGRQGGIGLRSRAVWCRTLALTPPRAAFRAGVCVIPLHRPASPPPAALPTAVLPEQSSCSGVTAGMSVWHWLTLRTRLRLAASFILLRAPSFPVAVSSVSKAVGGSDAFFPPQMGAACGGAGTRTPLDECRFIQDGTVRSQFRVSSLPPGEVLVCVKVGEAEPCSPQKAARHICAMDVLCPTSQFIKVILHFILQTSGG